MTFVCEVCDVCILSKSKSNHFKTNLHKKNLEMKGSGKRIIKSTTEDKYKKGMNLIAKLVDRDPTKILEWVDDVEHIIPILKAKYPNPSSFNFYVTSLQHYSKQKNDGKGIYVDEIQKATKKTQDIREQNKLSPQQQENDDFNGLTWDKLINNIDLRKANAEERLIIAMYTMFPPRRGATYMNMKYSNGHKKSDDKLYNYVSLTKAGNPSEFIFNAYKTAKTYGQQRFKIPDKLKSYFNAMDPKAGDFVFPNRRTDKSMNDFIQRTFEKYTGYEVGSQMLRRLFITDFLKEKSTVKQRKDIAYKMAHSVEEQSNYELIE